MKGNNQFLGEKWQKLTMSLDLTTSHEVFEMLCNLYSGRKRYYHNLLHITNMLRSAQIFDEEECIHNATALEFAIWFHDAIYDPLSKENELKSKALAIESLQKMGASESLISETAALVMVTAHGSKQDLNAPDADFMHDIDLEVLGQKWEDYRCYSIQIRSEYRVVPNLLYKLGRKKVLRQFLDSEFIYRTTQFRARYEVQARSNLEQEIEQLSGKTKPKNE